jgi:hypothetical protein
MAATHNEVVRVVEMEGKEVHEDFCLLIVRAARRVSAQGKYDVCVRYQGGIDYFEVTVFHAHTSDYLDGWKSSDHHLYLSGSLFDKVLTIGSLKATLDGLLSLLEVDEDGIPV